MSPESQPPPDPTPEPPEPAFEEGAEAPPPGVRAMAIVRWAMLVVVALVAAGSVASFIVLELGHRTEAPRSARYRCPMHPQIVADRPGECPVCHMDLELVTDERVPAASSGSAPAVSSSPPGMSGMSPPPGTAPITLALDRTQAIGVRTVLVDRAKSSSVLRATAAVEAPEQGRAEIHTRSPGFVEALRVTQTGVAVRAGEVVASVYSPEIYQAELDLLTVNAWPPGSGPPPPIEPAKQRLELLGMGKATVDRILATGKPVHAISLTSPISGYVTKRSVVLGSFVTPDVALFEIADLLRVYVVASVHARDLPSLRAGMTAIFATPSLPGRAFELRSDLAYPELDPGTRTARVRFTIDNKDLALRPGQLGTIDLDMTSMEAAPLTVPLDAVIDTGMHVYVFVVEGGVRFVPRAVELGDEMDEGRRVVLRGLAEGERIVSGATFLIDAESRLQASLAETPTAAGTAR